MFPRARHNFHPNSKNKIPIPSSVTLHNLRPDRESSLPWYNQHHDGRWLPKIRLDILVGDEEAVVYSSCTSVRSVHPSWEHLEERIDLPEGWCLSHSDLYQSMRFRFTSVDEENGSERIDQYGLNPAPSFFLEFPVYPTNVERLTACDFPPSLPVNACVIYYSDGSIRLPPHVFETLLHLDMATPPPLEDFSRFEDDAFDTLDGVASTPERQRLGSASQLLGAGDKLERETQIEHAVTVPTTISFDLTEQNVNDEVTERERIRLKSLIEREEAALEAESLCLVQVCMFADARVISIFYSTFSLLAGAENACDQPARSAVDD